MRSDKLKNFLSPTFSQASSCDQGNRAGDLRSALTVSRPVNVARTTERKLIMSFSTLIATLLMIHPGYAEVLTTRMIEIAIPLDHPNRDDPLYVVWNAEMERIAKLQADHVKNGTAKKIKGTTIYAASFKFSEQTLVVSTTMAAKCKYTPPSSPAAENVCPAKIFTIKNGAVVKIVDVPDFAFSAIVSSNGSPNNGSDTDYTTISFDTSTSTLTSKLVVDGQSENGVTIHLDQ